MVVAVSAEDWIFAIGTAGQLLWLVAVVMLIRWQLAVRDSIPKATRRSEARALQVAARAWFHAPQAHGAGGRPTEAASPDRGAILGRGRSLGNDPLRFGLGGSNRILRSVVSYFASPSACSERGGDARSGTRPTGCSAS